MPTRTETRLITITITLAVAVAMIASPRQDAAARTPKPRAGSLDLVKLRRLGRAIPDRAERRMVFGHLRRMRPRSSKARALNEVLASPLTRVERKSAKRGVGIKIWSGEKWFKFWYPHGSKGEGMKVFTAADNQRSNWTPLASATTTTRPLGPREQARAQAELHRQQHSHAFRYLVSQVVATGRTPAEKRALRRAVGAYFRGISEARARTGETPAAWKDVLALQRSSTIRAARVPGGVTLVGEGLFGKTTLGFSIGGGGGRDGLAAFRAYTRQGGALTPDQYTAVVEHRPSTREIEQAYSLLSGAGLFSPSPKVAQRAASLLARVPSARTRPMWLLTEATLLP